MFKWMLILTICTIIYTIPKFILSKWLNYYNIDCKKNIIFHEPGYAKKEKVISITIDDAPYGNSFGEIVSIFNKNKVHATFFVISDYVKWFRDDIVDAVKDGHELANHGSMNRMAAWLSTDDLNNEISFCNDKIYDIYDEAHIDRNAIKFYRPGCGFVTKNMVSTITKLNMKIVLGSVYPHDAHVPVWQINLWYLQAKIESGDIIVLHDRKWTIPLLRELLPWLKKEGYTIKPLSKFIT